MDLMHRLDRRWLPNKPKSTGGPPLGGRVATGHSMDSRKSLNGNLPNVGQKDKEWMTSKVRGMISLNKSEKPETGPLCKFCSKLNFGQFSNPSHPGQTRETPKLVLNLYTIISNSKKQKCNFCCLLFEAISAHDPFEHPAVKDHMPPNLVGKTFRTWAEELGWKQKIIPKASNPFGKGADRVQLDLNEDLDRDGADGAVAWTIDQEYRLGHDLALAGHVAAANSAVHVAIDKPGSKPTPSAKPKFLNPTIRQQSLPGKPPRPIPGNSGTSLKRMNGHGLGIAIGAPDIEKQFLETAKKLLTERGSTASPKPGEGPPAIPSRVTINDRCLVCETQVAKFMLHDSKQTRREILWQQERVGEDESVTKEPEVAKELYISEAEIRDRGGTTVGHVIPTDSRQSLHGTSFDFILLSESQYWGDEKRVDVEGFPLYNVMMVEWDNNRETCSRLGLGKIQKQAWEAASPVLSTVVLT